jgi:hypothetical protein
MTEERPSKVGIDAVMEYWEDTAEGLPYWSIWWNSRQKAKQFNKDDFEGSKLLLENWLKLNNDPSDTTRHFVVIHPKAETAYTAKSDQVESFPFRFNPAPERYGEMGSVGGGMSWQMMQMFSKLERTIDEQKRQIADLEKPVVTDMMGQINGLLENPHIGPVLASVVAGVIGKFINIPQAYPQARALAGVPGSPAASQETAITAGTGETLEQFQQRVNDALVRLQEHCNLADDLTLLANMADSNPSQFKMLLGMLRT